MRFIIFYLLLSAVLYCQNTDTLKQNNDTRKRVEIELEDGNSFIGFIERQDSAYVYFNTINGLEQKIPLSQIRSINPASGNIVSNIYYYDDPNATRFFLSPTARALGSGKVYFSAFEIFFPLIGIGITKYGTLAGGISLIPTASGQLFYITAKVTPLQMKKFNAAAGIIYANVLGSGSGDNSGYAFLYSAFTFGDKDNAVTFGAGYDLIKMKQAVPAFNGESTTDNSHIYYIMLGGETRLSKSIKIITENYYYRAEESNYLVSGGIRFFGSHLAGDFGLFTFKELLTNSDGFPFLPWLGFTYNF